MDTLSIAPKSQKTESDCLKSWIYVPTDFDPEQYDGPIRNHPDAARWFLNCLHFRRVTRHFGHDEFLNLHTDLLKIVMGKSDYVRPVREALIHHGLVECDYTWSLGVKSLGYRIGPALSRCRWHRYMSEDKRFLKRVAAFKQFITSQDSLTQPQHLHLAKWAKEVRVDPRYLSNLQNLEPKQKEFAVQQVERIQQRLLHFSVCPYGRFHSNFSSLSRKVRPYLIVQGQPIHEIDIVNSQPYFLNIILLEIACSTECKNVISLSNLVFQEMAKRGEEEKKRNEGLYVPPLRRSVLDTLPGDLRQFAQTALKGGFYEAFQKPGQSDRDLLKQQVFQVLYGSRHCQANAELGPEFKRQYPTPFQMLDNLKKEMGYEWVGRELQRRESQVVIDGLVGELQAHYSHIPIVTVHDSILTTQEHLGTVEALWRQRLSRNYFQPRMKQKSSALPEVETMSHAA